MTTVSVIIPAYNQAKFVGDAIRSAFAQTSRDLKVIVVNDGSTDNTTEVLESFGDQIRVISQDNAGLSAARNAGLRHASGTYVALLDADDAWYPQMLEKSVALLEECRDIDWVYTWWEEVNADGDVIRTPVQVPEFDDPLKAVLLCNQFAPSATVYRRSCFACCGVFDEHLTA